MSSYAIKIENCNSIEFSNNAHLTMISLKFLTFSPLTCSVSGARIRCQRVHFESDLPERKKINIESRIKTKNGIYIKSVTYRTIG